MVPGSTLRYGSSFCMVTRRPRAVSRLPRLEAVSPLPRDEATPPVTNKCLVMCGAAKGCSVGSEADGKPSGGPRSSSLYGQRAVQRDQLGLNGGLVRPGGGPGAAGHGEPGTELRLGKHPVHRSGE